MKHLFLTILGVITFVTSYAQSSILDNSTVKTKGGAELSLFHSYRNGEYYSSIHEFYWDYSKKVHFFTVENKFGNFKADLKTLLTKYKEWERTAKTNRVQFVEKEMPCNIGFTVLSNDEISNPTQSVLKTYFVVSDYVPKCEIRMWQYYYSEVAYHVWKLTSEDIQAIINHMDLSLQDYIKIRTEKKRTEDLFK